MYCTSLAPFHDPHVSYTDGLSPMCPDMQLYQSQEAHTGCGICSLCSPASFMSGTYAADCESGQRRLKKARINNHIQLPARPGARPAGQSKKGNQDRYIDSSSPTAELGQGKLLRSRLQFCSVCDTSNQLERSVHLRHSDC